jgi:predicted metalloprotease
MRLDHIQPSENFEDRRGVRLRRGAAIGGGSAVVALVLALLGAPQEVVEQVLRGGGSGTAEETAGPIDPAQAPLKDRALRVMATTESTWGSLFQQQGQAYQKPKIIFFSEAVNSACGMAGSAEGPL